MQVLQTRDISWSNITWCWKEESWIFAWWLHQMETFSALLAICAGNLLVSGEFPSQRPVTRGFDVFFDLCLNKRLNEQSWGWWFEMPSCPLRRHCNGFGYELRKDTHYVDLTSELWGVFSKFFGEKILGYIDKSSKHLWNGSHENECHLHEWPCSL